MISNLQMVTIYVSDMARAVKFYIEQLGFVQVAEYNDGWERVFTAHLILQRKVAILMRTPSQR